VGRAHADAYMQTGAIGAPNARIPEKHVRLAADKGSVRVRLSVSRARFVCPRAYFIERVI